MVEFVPGVQWPLPSDKLQNDVKSYLLCPLRASKPIFGPSYIYSGTLTSHCR